MVCLASGLNSSGGLAGLTMPTAVQYCSAFFRFAQQDVVCLQGVPCYLTFLLYSTDCCKLLRRRPTGVNIVLRNILLYL